MHTFSHGDVTFNFNSDLSGEVIIRTGRPEKVQDSIEVPGEALLAFIANVVRDHAIEALESMPDDNLIRLLMSKPIIGGDLR